MWKLMAVELRYAKGRALAFYAGAVLVAFLTRETLRLTGMRFGPGSFDGYFLYSALLFGSGLVLHLVAIWEATVEHRTQLHLVLPVTHTEAGLARLIPPIVWQFLGLVLAMAVCAGLYWGGVPADGVVPFDALDAAVFLVFTNGAALVFFLGWAHLGQQVSWLKQEKPVLAVATAIAAVTIAVLSAGWALAPWLSPEYALSPGARPSQLGTAALFHLLAVALVGWNLWLFRRSPKSIR